MFKLGITDVSFMVCNTDRQALERSPIPNKIRLGETLTEGLGAGNKPEKGKAAAEESIEEIKEAFRENNIRMVFVTAGMGGGTGTGAAPVIARAAKEMGILTVAIVTIPFKTEGRRRIMQAIEGIEEIRHNVDSLLVVNNENIHEIYGELTLSEAFGKADDILATAAKSIAEIITQEYRVNVDFADVQTVMKDSGIALMGSARGSGDSRAIEVAQMAMSSPLLNHKDISGAKNVLLNITSGSKEVTLTETYQITQFMQERTGNDNSTDLIWGAGTDETLGDDIRITVIATGFDIDSIPAIRDRYAEIVDRDSNLKKRQQEAAMREPVAPKREMVSLIENENDGKNKKKKTEHNSGAGDDFAVVTHNGGSGYGEDREDSGVSYYEQRPVEIVNNTVIEAPLGSEPNPYWNASPTTSVVDVPPLVAAGSMLSAEEVLQPLPREEQVVVEPMLSAPVFSGQVAELVTTTTLVDDVAGATTGSGADMISPVTSLTEEELENIPAFIRRRMKIDAEILPAGSKVSRETLKNDPSSSGSSGSGSKGGGQHLFD